MTRHALIRPDNTIDRFASDIDPTVQTKPGFAWRACPKVGKPAFNIETEIVEGPTYTVNANDVTEVWTKRNLTAGELRDRKDTKVNAVDALQFWVAFDMENRVRALESKPAITAAQYRAALKARL